MSYKYTAPENARVTLMFDNDEKLYGYTLTINNETFEFNNELL